MTLAALFTKHVVFKLTPEEREQFRAEQCCSISVAGLPVVKRIFI